MGPIHPLSSDKAVRSAKSGEVSLFFATDDGMTPVRPPKSCLLSSPPPPRPSSLSVQYRGGMTQIPKEL